jgi:quercetin dioxygenase-like cupin family protein
MESEMTKVGRIVIVVATIAFILLPTGGNASFPLRDIILNNESARVAEVTFHPGIGSGRHMGVEPEIGIITEGELVFDTPQGRQVMKRGQVYWLPGLIPHDVRNEGNARATMWEILLYRCQ